jgi:type I restriction enzyme S subunit
MSSDWPLRALDELADEVTVGYVGPMAAEYVESGIPFLRSLNVEPYRINTTDLKFVSAEFHRRIKKSALRPGDVAIVRTGKPGTCAVIPDWLYDANCSDLVIARCGGSLRPRFLCYWVNSIAAHHIASHTVGAVQQHFNVGAAKSMQVAAPSLRDQDAVISVLGSLDDRVALLRETNATLEAIAQALFKSWFVDFDPVRAKSQGLAPAGMDEATAALFPDSFEESALGLAPKTWETTKLGTAASYLNRGISPKYVDVGGVLVINQKCVRDFKVDLSKARRHDDGQRGINGRELRVGDVLVNSTGVGTLGRVAQVLTLAEPTIVDSHVTVVRAGGRLSWNYLGLAMMRRQAEIEELGEGTTGQTELNRGKLAGLAFVVPPREVLEAFDASTLPLRMRFAANSHQAETLATLRDTLLPRLISGQLRLPEAFAEMEEAA